MRTRIPILIAVAALAVVAAGALAPPDAAAQPAQPPAAQPPAAQPTVRIAPAPAAPAPVPGQPPAAQPAPVQVQLPAAQPVPGQPPVVVQPVQPPAGAQAAPRAAAQPAPRATAVLDPEPPPHLDTFQSTGKGMALLFWAFALAAVGGAIFVITRRNLIAAVMGMIASFLGIAAVYMMLYASFLSVVQMLVYAGAIMVLFVFVIMILNRPEDEPVAPSGRFGQVIGAAAMLYLVFRLATVLVNVQPPETAMGPPPAKLVDVPQKGGGCDPARCEEAGGLCATVTTGQPQVCRVAYDWGSVKAVGTDLFGPGVFPFEAISILLLVAVVGAIAIARPLHEDAKPGADAGGDRP